MSKITAITSLPDMVGGKVRHKSDKRSMRKVHKVTEVSVSARFFSAKGR